MDRPPHGDRKDSQAGIGGHARRRSRRRRRTLLNLGVPFVQIDDFLNQGEDAVALGCRVLEETVEEIKAGYAAAKDFNEAQRQWDGTGPAPAIPWVELVDRVQKLQDIAMSAVGESTQIVFDSVRSGTKSVRSVARTWEQSRDDVEEPPALAGPVFVDPVVLSAMAGSRPEPQRRDIRHPGLARLRINAMVDHELKRLARHGTGAQTSATLTPNVQQVSFEPKAGEEETSTLTVDFGEVPADQPPGEYEGFIRARNFALLIAKVRVEVTASDAPVVNDRDRRRASATARPRTRRS